MLGDRRVLKGLPGVRVEIKELRPAAAAAGFNAQTFQRDVELKLRTAGIRVFDTEDREERPLPVLYLDLTPLCREKRQRDAYGVTLALLERTFLRRHFQPAEVPAAGSEDLTSLVVTWSSGAVGYGDVSHARGVVKDLADDFANDYLAANPLNGSRLADDNPP